MLPYDPFGVHPTFAPAFSERFFPELEWSLRARLRRPKSCPSIWAKWGRFVIFPVLCLLAYFIHCSQILVFARFGAHRKGCNNDTSRAVFPSASGYLDERQSTHLICARIKYDLYDFFRGCFWAFCIRKTTGRRSKHPLKKSYRSYFRRAQIR